MKKITLFTFIAIFSMALIGCSTTGNTNVKVNSAVNANTAVVVNANAMPVTNANVTNTTTTTNRYNTNMTREEYEKNQADYETDRAGSTIGTGANDKWLWFKTKAALATTNELRDSTINVDVTNDVVTLRGTVANNAEADKAKSVAKGIDGVKDVKSILKIQPNDSMTNQMTGTNTTTTTTNTKTNANR